MIPIVRIIPHKTGLGGKNARGVFKFCRNQRLILLPVSLRDISLRQGISLDFLEQIFSKLKRNEIVQSIRGTQGGYILNKQPNEIKLANIFHAVDETVKTVQCKKESKKGCNGKASKCITHNLWDELETHINNFFENKSLEDLLTNNRENRIQ